MTPAPLRWIRSLARPHVDPDQLIADARDAAAVRRHETDPDVIAYMVARARTAVDRWMWAGIIAGLAYCASSVQQWGAGPAPTTQQWWTAWLLTAPVEIPLVAILYGEQVVLRHGGKIPPVVRLARIGLLLIMLTLNGWGPVTALGQGGTVGAVVAHLAVPAAIILATEAITGLRDAIGAAIESAVRSTLGRRTRQQAGRRPAGRHGAPSPADEPDTDDADQDQDADRDDDQDGAAGVSIRERAVAWYLDPANWPPGEPEPPMPAAMRKALFALDGTNVSRGESSRARTDAKTRRAEATA